MPANPIVVVNVNQIIAPTLSTLQQTGVMVSHGGTTYSTGTRILITQLSDLLPYIVPAKAISAATWSSGTVTITTTTAHGFTAASTFYVVISGMVPSSYNGNYLCTVTTTTQFTYALVASPGTATTFGTYQIASATEILGMATTYFSQGYNFPVYVIDFGTTTTYSLSAANLVTVMNTYIQNNLFTIYQWLLPRYLDSEPTFLTFLQQYENTTALIYFHVTTTTSTYTQYTNLMKCVLTTIEAPSVITNTALNGGSTEFSAAAQFYQTLIARPSDTNKVAPFAFRFLFGVTPYPTSGNGPLLTALAASNCGYIATGAEGGISDTMAYPGCTEDGRDFLYWFATDWTNINLNLNISNEIINGSNNPINPLYINQDGINRLQARGASTLSTGVTYGLLQGNVLQTELDSTTFNLNLDAGVYAGQVVINAIPFLTYYTDNPSDYKSGTYNGLSAVVLTSRGFLHIIFNLTITDFVTQ